MRRDRALDSVHPPGCPPPHRAAVIDEPRQVATLGGIDDGVMVHPKQVAAANAFLHIALLPHVGHHLRARARGATLEHISSPKRRPDVSLKAP